MMSLRKALLVPLLISLSLFIYYSGDIQSSADKILNNIMLNPGLVASITIAVILQLIGHAVRAYKTRYVLMEIRESSAKLQFRAFAIGTLFNALLPLRLGELVRARIVATAMRLSFSMALVIIILERALDAVIIGILGLVIFMVATSGAAIPSVVATVIITGLLMLMAIICIAVSPGIIRRPIYTLSSALNARLKDGMRFKSWSVIYGMQVIARSPKRIALYLLLGLLSWISYGASLYVLAFYFFGSQDISQQLSAAIAPYFGIAVPAGPASLGSFSNVVQSIFNGLNDSILDSLTFVLFAWAVLVIPTSLIGLVLLVLKTRESLWHTPVIDPADESFHNKLDRTSDISKEMSVFLENYFSGNSLSSIVHHLEVNNKFKLIKYFRGGSDAITILVNMDGQRVVKKIIPIQFEDRLKAQYDWLLAYKDTPGIVQVYGEAKTESYYTIDMSYNSNDVPFFDYIHNHSINESKQAIQQIWNILEKNVYKNSPKSEKIHDTIDTYIDKHIYKALESACAVDPDILKATEPDSLVINGRTYDNLNVVIERIKNNKSALHDLSTYRESKVVHGDVIIDNILINKISQSALIIDPAPDGNIINGRVFDFSKTLQSLHCGYEFLLRDESAVVLKDGKSIDYAETRSDQYAKLSHYVMNDLAKAKLTKSEQRSLLFHTGTLFIRRLKHQVYYTPENALKFYAVGVKTLNEFIDQYDRDGHSR